MLNSATYMREENVNRPGEHVAPEHDLRTPGLKIYYSRIKGSITHLPDGTQITFRGGQFATANEEIKAYLDKISNKQGSQVYTEERVADALVNEVASAAEGASAPAGNAETVNIKPDAETVKASVRVAVPVSRAAVAASTAAK